MCSCEQDGKSVCVSKKVHQKTNCKDDSEAMVDQISLAMKGHYRELTRCVSSVNNMLEVLREQVERPTAVCEVERDALECCLECETHSADCSEAVEAYVACVRKHLFLRTRNAT